MSLLLLFRPRGPRPLPPVVIDRRVTGKPWKTKKQKRRDEYLVQKVGNQIYARHDFRGLVVEEERKKRLKKRKKQTAELLMMLDFMFDDDKG